MTDTTKPKSGGDLSETEAMQVDEDDAAIESGNHERLPPEVTNAVDNSGLRKDDQVVQTLQDAGFRTPKDLIDRENDLYDVKLGPRSFVKLGSAIKIERMRNTSASNSVDNAALGLTTKDKQQHIAARDDAHTDAQRVAEFDEQIREVFATYRRENTLEWQRENLAVGQLLRNAVPRNAFANEVDVIASSFDAYVGNAYEELHQAVRYNFYGRDAHEGQSTAIVQAFGCGKSRAALQLSKDYVLLPLKTERDHKLVQTLIDAQNELFDLMIKSEPAMSKIPIANIRKFSDSCLRLVHLVLLALQALYKHCEGLNLVGYLTDDQRELSAKQREQLMAVQRHDMAVLLQFRTAPLVQWTVDYFKRRKDEILCMPAVAFQKLLEETAMQSLQRRVIFLLDEAHEILPCSRGYCLHKDANPPEHPSVVQAKWLSELHGTAGSVTNLLYQFRRVSHEYLTTANNCTGFVMCSTAFSLWNLDLDLATTRGQIERFCELHWFTGADVLHLIHHFFNVQVELLTKDAMIQMLQRPGFVAALIKELANGSIAGGVKQWIDTSVENAMNYARAKTEEQVKRLVEKANGLVYLVYIMNKLCGGILDLKYATEGEFVELVNCGVVRLVRSGERRLICDDPLFIAQVQVETERQIREKRNDPVMEELVSPLMLNVSDDKALKGTVAERIIAWLALCDGLKVADNEALTFLPHMGSECRAGTAKQLLQQQSLQLESESDLIWRVMTDPSFPWVLFPSDQCGPDILFRQRNDGACIVVVQCKMKKNVMALAEFNEALLTLHPTCFFKSPRNAEVEVHQSDDRISWLTRAKQLKDFAFERIVFEPLGFSPLVQYLVREYNAAQKQRTSTTFIHLLTLNDLEAQVSKLNYERILNLVQTNAVPKVMKHKQLMLQSEWMSRNRDQDNQLPIDMLKEMCDVRDINVTWTPSDIENAKVSKKPYEAKTEAELIRFLDEYKVKEKLAALKWDLP